MSRRRSAARCLGSAEIIDGAPAAEWAARMTAELQPVPRGPPAAAHHRDGLLRPELPHHGGAQDRPSAARRRAGRRPPAPVEGAREHVVLATGSHERPLVFADNDRPGVMLAGAARTYVNRYGVLPGAGRSSSPTMTAPTRPPSISSARAAKLPPLSICGPRRSAHWRIGRANSASAIVTGSGVVATERPSPGDRRWDCAAVG